MMNMLHNPEFIKVSAVLCSENDNDILWDAVMERMKKKYGLDTFKSWFSHLKLLKKENTILLLSVPTPFIKRWLEDNYMDDMLSTCKIFFPSLESIEITVDQKSASVVSPKNYEPIPKYEDIRNNTENIQGNSDTYGKELWSSVVQQLKNEYPFDVFNSRFKDMEFVRMKDSILTVSAKQSMDEEHINELTSVCKRFFYELDSIEIVAKDEASFNMQSSKQHSTSEQAFWSPLDKRFTFDNFVVGKPNELAFTAAKRVAESCSPVPGSNPLFLYGGVGLGKTHLMHAIAWYIIKNTQRRVVYLSAEKFMHSYVQALRNKNIMLFKNAFRSVDILMVDDVQFISGKDSTQEEFFHTFNALIDNNKQLVISADRSPSDLDGVEERIRSRLGWGLVADINESTFELRLGILQSKVEAMGVFIDQKVLEFLAKNIRSNIRELEGALNKCVINASLRNTSITIDFVRETLEALLRSYSKVVSIDEIKRKVAEFFGIRITDMCSYRRSRNLARPRQVAMYLSKLLTNHSLQEIGRAFARDHATVIHATKQVEKLMELDPRFMEDMQHLINLFR